MYKKRVVKCCSSCHYCIWAYGSIFLCNHPYNKPEKGETEPYEYCDGFVWATRV